jgi:isopenicillin N synthase-like dioxygenase
MPEFEPAMRAYFEACEALAGRLMEALSRSLGAPENEMHRLFEPTHTSFLRLNFYPVDDPLGDEADGGADLGIHHHSDAGALTVLLQDEVSGLQVYRKGAWHLVEPLDGAFVINIGDMVQVWSNDLYRAPIHRVLAMNDADRTSIPFFYNPSYEARIAPLDDAVRRSGRPHYSAIPWGEYRRRRADGDFADYGAEVQISDYRI